MMRTEERDRLHFALRRTMEDSHGQVSRASAEILARTFNISVSQLRREARVLKGQLIDTRSGAGGAAAASTVAAGESAGWWERDEPNKQVLTALGGNSSVHAAWKQLVDDGVIEVGYPTFTRQLKKRLSPAVHAGLTAHGQKKGREAYLDASLYCTEKTEGRNTRWQADVQYVPVRVRSATGTRVEEVFQITFLDEATRLVTGTMLLTRRPTGQDVAATLASAIAGKVDADGNFYGGLPKEIRWDRGGEFLNEVMTEVCARLGIVPIPSPAYGAWRKGKIERFHRTIQQACFARMNGYVAGPETFTGTRPWRGADEDLMFFDAFLVQALAGVEAYNTEHVHSVIGTTPEEAWLRDRAPIVTAPPQALHALMLAVPRTRVVGKDGISYKKVKYLSPTLSDFRRRKVEIRVLPHDVDRIWVFEPGTDAFICTAVPAERLSLTDRRRLLRKRDADYARVRTAIAEGTARREQDQLINDVLVQEEQARATEDGAAPTSPARSRRRNSGKNGKTRPADDGEHGHEPDELGFLDADIDGFLDTFGDDA